MSVAKRIARSAGATLSIGCIAWVGWNFYTTGVLQQASTDGSLGNLAWRVAGAIPIYAAAVVVLGIAWAALQRVFVEQAPTAPAVGTYLVTQAYKYLPGGVLQYVGRHAGLRKLGMSHASLACCAMAEAACLVAVAAIASSTFASQIDARLDPMVIRFSVVVASCVSVAVIGGMRHRLAWIRRHIPVFRVRWVAVAIGLYAVFFLLMGLTLTTVVPKDVGGQLTFTRWAAVAAASWIAGYVVVGAPAGLGVREAVFIALLAVVGGRPAILLMAASFRMATFGGDIVACGAGLLCNRYLKRFGRL